MPAPPWDESDDRAGQDPDGTKETVVAIRAVAGAPVPTPTNHHALVSGRDDHDLEPGARLGEYRILAKIGQGGMGVVYSAVHPLIGKGAAIKVLKKDLCADPHQLERFMDEARVVNQIGHPNIVDIFAFGEMPDGRSYLVMELLKGETLRARIARSTLDAAEVNAIVRPLARALEAAHEKGVIHRDLKPDNVFLVAVRGESSTVKLLDFGIAKLARNDHRVEKTATGVIVGTPQYIAPEQAKGYAIDHRADIYALGGIVYELMTGRPPFVADNAMEMVAKHLMETPLPPSHFTPSVSPEIDSLVLRMLAKTPDGRPTLAEVCEVVERAKLRASTPTPFASAGIVRVHTGQPPPADASRPVDRRSFDAIPQSGSMTAPSVTVSQPGYTPAVSQIQPEPYPEAAPRRRTPLWIAIVGVPLAGLAAFLIVTATDGGAAKKSPQTAKQSATLSESTTATGSNAVATTGSNPATGSNTATKAPDSNTTGSITKAPAITPPPVPPIRAQPSKAQLRLVITGARSPDIFIDGKRSTADVKLRPGLHEIEVRAPRMQSQKLQIDVAPGATTTKRIVLSPAPRPKATPPKKVVPVKVDPPKKADPVKVDVDGSELLSPGSLNNAPSRR